MSNEEVEEIEENEEVSKRSLSTEQLSMSIQRGGKKKTGRTLGWLLLSMRGWGHMPRGDPHLES